ncbi:Protein CBG14850 [Caenorhabditis briggsae]|nr:Protein CBG14850 [Caenorhabditis briggsae]CAP33268.1 Protein CBG14850 [Caenorhabditis briggsae]
MYLPVQILIFYFLELCYACIPTQQVEPTTTTTPVPATTATESPFPCSVCQKVYDPACQGFGIPSLLNWCPKAAEVGVEYLLGAVAALPFLLQESCSTTIICPPGTTPRINLFGFTDIAAPTPATLAYCRETGPMAGEWFTGIPPFEIKMASSTSNSRTNPNGGGGTNGGGALTTAATTTTVATTTVTEPPFPCNNCPKIYDTTCQGFGIPNWYQWCPTAAEVGIEYTLGLITTLFPFIPLGSCG